MGEKMRGMKIFIEEETEVALQVAVTNSIASSLIITAERSGLASADYISALWRFAVHREAEFADFIKKDKQRLKIVA